MDYAKRAAERGRLDMSDADTRDTALRFALAAKDTEGWGQMPDGWAPPIIAGKGPLWVVFTENDHPDGSAIVAITGNGPTSEANARFFVDAKRMVLALLEEQDRLATCLRNVEGRHAAELQAAHDAGVAEGKAGERALEMFVVRSLAHEVDGGDDKTAEQLIEMLLAERDAARSAGVAERNAEVATLRQIISDAAREVGAQVSPECSLEFMALLPREVAMALRRAEKTANDAGVAEERARWVQVATAARSALGKYAHDTGYGFFIGGDPRRFSPDEESSTSEEIAAWKAACAEAEADEKARDLASPCGLEIVEHEGRNVPAFVDRAPFGLGTYECGDEEAAAACEAITALLGDGLIAGATESNEGGR